MSKLLPPARRRRSAVPLTVVDGGPPIQSVAKGRSKKLSICVYGDPGIGKTVLAGSCAELPGKNGGNARVCIIRPPVDHTDSIDDPNVDELVVTGWSEMDDAMLYARNDGAEKYDWFWLDSLSLWQDQGLDDIWEQVINEKPHRKRYGLDKQEYGINMLRIGQFVRHMVGCPHWNFGVTCHPRITESTEDEEDPQEKLMPWVQGKMMAPKVCGYMNVVGYLHWDKVGKSKTQTRVLDTIGTDKFYAKYAVTKQNPFTNGRIINPSMPKLAEAINMSKGSRKSAPAEEGRRTTTRRRRAAAGRK